MARALRTGELRGILSQIPHFLEEYAGVAVIKYEDFVADPKQTMLLICDALELGYSDKFTQLFDVFRFSGDSGRKDSVIRARVRREMSKNFMGQVKSVKSYLELISQLEYEAID